ncbi:zinc finger protein 512 isoform X3 [Caloenas nicobarica]|uniref:zinc finger protein 512 isoform X3 n=1 Tax=Caloenas nicobarica TaxID=187106 RepID=UPI0032B789C6
MRGGGGAGSARGADTRPGHHRQQKAKRSLGSKKSEQIEEVETAVPGLNSSCDETVSDGSSASLKSQVNGNAEPRSKRTIRRPTYWLEMSGVKSSVNKSSEEKAGEVLKGKRKSEQGEGEDLKDSPKKKQKILGKNQQAETQQNSKTKGRCAQKEPETYDTGSTEEQWSLEIQDKGRVTCPTCRAVVRKTVEGLKKHMVNCRQEMFTCHHCGKQLKSLGGMKYHVMADHNNQPVVKEGGELDEQLERDRLRKVLKRMGKLKCTREGCTGSFTSIMGYLYHIKKCGKAASELEKMAMKCHHCGKAYKSKAGLVYHLRSKHGPGCESVYGSVSGLKSHLGTCTLGDFVAGKYKCLLCEKEFISESGVKYHINSVHAEDWFDANTTTTKSFEKLMKIRQREEQKKQRKKRPLARGRKKRTGALSAKKVPTPGVEKMSRSKRGHPQQVDNESASGEEGEPQAAQSAELPKASRKRGRK